MARCGRVLWLLVAAVLASVASTPDGRAEAQKAETQKVVAGPQYDRSGSWRFWFGEGYRRASTTPVELPAIDPQTEAGGLRPLKQVGGLQSVGLALAGGAGFGLMTQLIGVPFVLSSSVAWGDSEKGVSFYVRGGYSF